MHSEGRGAASSFSRAEVPWGLDIAAAWSWRLLLIAGAVLAGAWVLAYLAVISLPIAIALLITAMASPAVRWLTQSGLPRSLSTLIVVVGGMAALGALLTFVGRTVAQGASGLAAKVREGFEQIHTWLREGPLGLTDSQVQRWLERGQEAVSQGGQGGEVVTQVTEVGTAVGHTVAGFFIVIFATYFFLADGHRIWSWIVGIAPRAARERVDSSGRVAWISLTQFVRATVLVALVDAIGIMIVALILQVPFVLALGVLVFIGAFIPMVGATVAGGVAVLVALVDQGPFVALLMLGGVILVQQIESHVLQPFLMGRFVSVHPLGVIISIACGVLVGGIAGALVAVPLVAAGNAVVHHLSQRSDPGDVDDDAPLGDDPGPDSAGLDDAGSHDAGPHDTRPDDPGSVSAPGETPSEATEHDGERV